MDDSKRDPIKSPTGSQNGEKTPPSGGGNSSGFNWSAGVLPIVGVMVGSAITLIGTYLTTESNRDAAKINSEAAMAAARGSFDAKMVEIGVNILSADPGKDVAPARQWAINLVEAHANQRFSDEDRRKLLHQPIQTFQWLPRGLNSNGTLGPDALSCDKWRHNPDGSWTSLGTFVMPGNNVFSGMTFRDTPEAAQLDQKCGGLVKP